MHIQIVEDDRTLSEGVAITLSDENTFHKEYTIQDAKNGFEDYGEQLSLIILDLNLPDGSGFDLCRQLKEETDIPVIFLTARDEESDVVMGLELGADDYMIKPFDTKELVARVKAVLRRYRKAAPAPEKPKQKIKVVEYPNLTINQTNYSVTYNGRELVMPPKELELLYFLASQPNQVFTREQLLDHIWGYEYIGDTRTVDVHIKRLREKISDHENWAIRTVWGIGYKFEVK